MYYGKLYGQEIRANTLAGLKAKASKIANKFNHVIDRMEVRTDQSSIVIFRRFNKVYPNNTIEYGDWH